MASISSQKIGSVFTWSLSFTTRSRSIAFNFSRLEPLRRQRHSPRSSNITQSPLRPFSTQKTRFQATPPPPPSTTTASDTRSPPPQTVRNEASNAQKEPIREYQSGLSDMPPAQLPHEQGTVDWTRSFHGLSAEPFPKETSDILMQPLSYDDVEIKPDGIVFLPEIKYRRILNRAFGPGGWGLAPRGETIVTPKSVTREYALLAHGRLISVARGEMDYFDSEGIPTAVEGCKSNALTRCCKDLGIASELWDPRWIRKFLKEQSRETWVEHTQTKRRRKITLRKDDDVKAPFKEVKMSGASGSA